MDKWDRSPTRVSVRVLRNTRGLRIVISKGVQSPKSYGFKVEDWPELKDLWSFGAILERQWRSPLLRPRTEYLGFDISLPEFFGKRVGRGFLLFGVDPIRVSCTFTGPWDGIGTEMHIVGIERTAMEGLVADYRRFLKELEPVLVEMKERDKYEDFEE